MNEIKRLADKGFTAEEISAHLEVPIEIVNEALTGSKPLASAALNLVENRFEDLRELAFEALEDVLRDGRMSDKKDAAKFVLKQQLGCYKPQNTVNNLTFLIQQFSDRAQRAQELALKAEQAAIDC